MIPIGGHLPPRWWPGFSPWTARYLPLINTGCRSARVGGVKSGREIVEILEAYDLTGSYRAAAELAGCDHHTVARYVKLRAEGPQPRRACAAGPAAR
jgi:hypothetical protein